jgi:poly-beta-1,6-N-acetyl-D-glucosamine synthase
VMARMQGWRVFSCPDLQFVHLKPTGSAAGSSWRASFRDGLRNYALGYHPLFFLSVCFYRSLDRPYVLGSLCRMLGYLWAGIRGEPWMVPSQFVWYLRREQLQKLRSGFEAVGLRVVNFSQLHRRL